MFLTVSIEDILKRIYAESALRFAAARISEKPSILIRDHEKALRRLIIDQFYEIVGMLAPAVIDFGPQPTPDDSEILYRRIVKKLC